MDAVQVIPGELAISPAYLSMKLPVLVYFVMTTLEVALARLDTEVRSVQ